MQNTWMPSINCEINLQLKYSKNVIPVAGTVANQNANFEITDTKLYVPVVPLSTQGNKKTSSINRIWF